MKDNNLIKISQSIDVSSTDEMIAHQVIKMFSNIDKIYSYLIYAKYKNNKLQEWIVQYMFSQENTYNTFEVKDIVPNIINEIINNKNNNKKIIAYKQPPLNMMIKLYQPLINKLVLEQCIKWPKLEHDDAMSMCILALVKLYNKGYYIHKYLLKKTFEHEILMSLRSTRYAPDTVSIYEIVYSNGEGNLTLEDMLPDKQAEINKQEQDEQEEILKIFEKVKALLIDMFGERQFNQLFRDYSTKNTTSWSRKKLQYIKNKFDKMGINWKTFKEND